MCYECEKVGHYARICRSRPRPAHLYTVEEGNGRHDHDDPCTTDDEYNFHVHTANATLARTSIELEGQRILVDVDSGASVDTIDAQTWELLTGRDNQLRSRLTPGHTRLYGYGSKVPLPIRGELWGTLRSPDTDKMVRARIVVTDGDNGCILSRESAIAIGLLRLHQSVCTIASPCDQHRCPNCV